MTTLNFVIGNFYMIDGKSVVALIPARGGSKGIPRKNLQQFKGQSLLARTIKIARMSQYIDHVVVSSEDAEIIQEAKLEGAEVPFVRPHELASDEASSVDVVLHAMSQLPSHNYVLLLQVTSPLRAVGDIDSSIEFCLKNCAPTCVSVAAVDKHPFFMVSINENGVLKSLYPKNNVSRRQDLPDMYVPNGAIYIVNTTWFLKNKTFISGETVGFVMPKHRSLDIDTTEDLFLLERYAELCETLDA